MRSIYEIQMGSSLELGKIKQNNINEILNGNWDYYLNTKTLFALLFKSIPNETLIAGIDCDKAKEWFFEKYNENIKDVFIRKTDFYPNFQSIVFLSFYDLIIEFNAEHSCIKLIFRKTNPELVSELINAFRKFDFDIQRGKPKIYVLVSDISGISLKALNIRISQLNIDENYNDDFQKIHQTIFTKLSSKEKSGIVLLHGLPGTGKTSYIRYLVSKIEKKVIFLPPNMAEAINNPQLTSILIEKPNSIIVIEDREKIVLDRNSNYNSAVSALLNMSDGLLSDFLNIQIICTFNTDISKVDNALMRKGRLIASYEFKELAVGKAQNLSRKLGFISEIKTPMTLTDIYNQNEMNIIPSNNNRPIGFFSR